jgi:hypothetical protein
MKAILNFRARLGMVGLLLVAGLLMSCETNQPRRNELSPFAPQRNPFYHRQ